jgi:hypothetical protein
VLFHHHQRRADARGSYRMIVLSVIATLAALPAVPGPGVWLKRVEGAAGLEDGPLLGTEILPAAFVALGEERATANGLIGAVHQDITVGLVVILVLSATGHLTVDASGEAAEAAIARIVTALVGTRPAGVDRELTYTGSRLVAIQNNQMWLELAFETQRHVRREFS